MLKSSLLLLISLLCTSPSLVAPAEVGLQFGRPTRGAKEKHPLKFDF